MLRAVAGYAAGDYLPPLRGEVPKGFNILVIDIRDFFRAKTAYLFARKKFFTPGPLLA
jgi:hypothetical protein